MRDMAAVGEIAVGDLVEVVEPLDDAPVGTRGGVTDLLEDDLVIVEMIDKPLEPILDRLLYAPLAALRVLP